MVLAKGNCQGQEGTNWKGRRL